MANPGYPMQPQQPPMGMPMGQPPPPMMGRPVRRGTSKAVPVVVSAGLAVGVFCGLLFGLGTGGDEATAATKSNGSATSGSDGSAGSAAVATPAPGSGSAAAVAQQGSGSAGSAADPAAGSGSGAVAAAGSGSGAAAGSGSAAAPAVAGKTTKLVVEITPELAAQTAKITVDGKDVAATSEVAMGDLAKKKVHVEIRAPGFKDVIHDGFIELPETKLSVDMQKKPRPAGGPAVAAPPQTPPPTNGGPKKPPPGKKPGGGLIDI